MEKILRHFELIKMFLFLRFRKMSVFLLRVTAFVEASVLRSLLGGFQGESREKCEV